MKKTACLALLALLFAACASDDEETPILVTEAALPASGPFAPGDEVTVSAQGFEAGDDVMFNLTWPLPSEAENVGVVRGLYAVITERTPTRITFLAPGGYPPSTAEVLLLRSGRMQSLGTISVTNGLPPAAASLYCLVTPDARNDAPRGIDRVDPMTGETTHIADFPPGGELSHAVNAVGTNRIYGLVRRESCALGAFYDLTMRYLRDSDPERYLLVGTLTSEAAYLRADGNRLTLSPMYETRTSPVVNPVWKLPDGLVPEMLTAYPFVFARDGSTLLLSADNGDGTWSPVVLSLEKGFRVRVGEPVACDGMIPFNTLRSETVDGRPVDYLVGGYAVSAAGGADSELRLFDPLPVTFGEPVATHPDPILSVTVDRDGVERKIYCLTASGQGTGTIRVFDPTEKAWQSFPGEYPYTEILLAR